MGKRTTNAFKAKMQHKEENVTTQNHLTFVHSKLAIANVFYKAKARTNTLYSVTQMTFFPFFFLLYESVIHPNEIMSRRRKKKL